MFAVIKTGGKQYLVNEGSVLSVEKLDGEKGGQIVFDQVLLLAKEDGEEVKMGQPNIEGAKVTAEILEQGRSKKITVIKYKRKVRYSGKAGHRQAFTQVKILKIA